MILLLAEPLTKMEGFVEKLVEMGTTLGLSVLKALIIFAVGRFLIGLLNKFTRRVLIKRKVDPSVRTFVSSLVNILLTIVLIVAVVGALGVQTTSIAALLASGGLAVGMALSGNLSNFAGGLIILLFKPYRVGDYIEAQNTGGTVKEIQIFHTLLVTPDGKDVFVPNGQMSSGVVVNYNVPIRRAEWVVGVEYGTDMHKVEQVVKRIVHADKRILPDPAPFFQVHAMSASSVNIVVRVWVNTPDYWDVYFETNKLIYETFNAEGIAFPFPQLTIHQAKDPSI